MAQPRLAIIGGGISGLVLATALHEKGILSTIYEQAAHFGEIGAGVAFGANAIRAMRYCSPKVEEAFREVSTTNSDPYDADGMPKWFDFVDGYNEDPGSPQNQKYLFYLNTTDRGGVHRAHFLDALIKHVPRDIAHFGKHLDTIEEQQDGTLTMKFHDGSTADADAIIGCDGIKSRVRQVIFGADNAISHPVYTHKKAYRGLVSMDRAASILGAKKAQNGYFHLGHRGHILTFPVAKGKTMNVVAFRHDDGEWPSDTKLTLPTDKEHALEDFKDFNSTAKKIIEMLESDLDCWAIFDTGTHPLPYFNKGRICLLGDAAHATSPHHGAGAGFCVEDAAVMSTILTQVKSKEGYAKAFEAFDAQRRARTQSLVQSSRVTGNLYEWMDPECGSDAAKIYEQLDWRTRQIWDIDTDAMIEGARDDIQRRIAIAKGHS